MWDCGNVPDPTPVACGAILRAYSAALSEAQGCDPSGADSCGASCPALECQCPVPVNAARLAKVNELLAEYAAAGCHIGCCPCPMRLSDAPPPSCQAADGGATCR